MKNNIKKIKVGLLVCLLLIVGSVAAQNTPLPTTFEALLVYKANSEFTLSAAPNSADIGAITSFRWSIKNAAGGADGIVAGALNVGSVSNGVQGVGELVTGTITNDKLKLSKLAPGYYEIIAEGLTSAGVCTGEAQSYVFFVMPPVTVSASVAADFIKEYCENELKPGGTSANQINVTYTTDATYSWNTIHNFGAAVNGTLAFTGNAELSASLVRVASAVETVESGPTDGSPSTFALSNTTVGTYTYKVKVSYKGGVNNIVNPVVYETNVKDNSGVDLTVKVTKRPSKPTITIEVVN